MIDYIKYTIDGVTYELTDNGDGTWSRSLDAPSVAGRYNLLLEVGQGGIVTYIDSSDPRYYFLLDVIEDVERRVNLIKYLPEFLQGVTEFKVLFGSEDIELDALYSIVGKTLLDAFIRTASAEQITRLENFYRYKGEGSLSQRKAYLMALYQKGQKLNEGSIKEIVKTITGSDCTVSFFGSGEMDNPLPGHALLQVRVLSPDGSTDYRYADVERTLMPLAPAHVDLQVIKYFSTWGEAKENYLDWQGISTLDSWQSLKDYIPPQ